MLLLPRVGAGQVRKRGRVLEYDPALPPRALAARLSRAVAAEEWVEPDACELPREVVTAQALGFEPEARPGPVELCRRTLYYDPLTVEPGEVSRLFLAWGTGKLLAVSRSGFDGVYRDIWCAPSDLEKLTGWTEPPIGRHFSAVLSGESAAMLGRILRRARTSAAFTYESPAARGPCHVRVSGDDVLIMVPDRVRRQARSDQRLVRVR